MITLLEIWETGIIALSVGIIILCVYIKNLPPPPPPLILSHHPVRVHQESGEAQTMNKKNGELDPRYQKAKTQSTWAYHMSDKYYQWLPISHELILRDNLKNKPEHWQGIETAEQAEQIIREHEHAKMVVWRQGALEFVEANRRARATRP